MVKFDRQAVQKILEIGENVELIISGKVFYNLGLADFEGFDETRVIDKGKMNNGNLKAGTAGKGGKGKK